MAAEDIVKMASQIARKEPGAIALLNQTYTELFGETIVQGCGNCYQKAFFRIQKYLFLNNNLTMDEVSERKYLLKKDRQIQTEFGGDTLTNDNLTDGAAEKLLKEHPALIKHFEKYPEVDVLTTTGGDTNETASDDEVKVFIDGLGDEKEEFLKYLNAEMANQEQITIETENGERDLTNDQLQFIIKELTPESQPVSGDDLTQTPKYTQAKEKFTLLYGQWNKLSAAKKKAPDGLTLKAQIDEIDQTIKNMEAPAPKV